MQITNYLIHGQVTPMGFDDLREYLEQYGTVDVPERDGKLYPTRLFPPNVSLESYQQEQPHLRIYHHGFMSPGDIYATGLEQSSYESLTDAINDFLDALERSKQS